MIPLRLKIQALGPYAGLVDLDFRELNAARAFLITGPTGGGKTTLFDAMQLALFGQTTGGERSGADMRSDLARPEVATEVDFRFALGDQTYRVKRSPEQERPKLRGEGMTRDEHKATLWRITGCDLHDDDCGEVLATKVNDVTRRVGDLLGLTAEEFRQIVVLPQDRFRELLTAGSAEREDILRTLFQTRFFARVQEILRDRSKAAGREQQQQRDQIAALLHDAEVETAQALRDRLGERSGQIEAAQEESGRKRQEHDAAARALDEARRTAALFDERDKRGRDLQELLADADRVDGLRARMERAGRAQTATSADDASKSAQERLERAQTDLDQAAARRERARASADAARTEFERQRANEQTREDARSEVQRLEALAPRIDRLQQAESRIRAADTALAAARSDHEKATQRVSSAREHALEAEKRLRAAEAAQGRLPGAEAQARAHAASVAAHDRIAQIDADLERIAGERSRIEGDLDRARGARGERESEVERVLTALQTAQAARMAADLVDGCPCPVCGSREHPDPAAATDAGDQPDVSEARRRLKESQDQERDLSERLAALRAQDESRREERARVVEQLGDQASETRADLEERRASAVRELEKLKADSRIVGDARADLEAASSQREQAEDALRRAEEGWREAESEKAAAASALESERRELPEEMRTQEALSAALGRARDRARELERAMEQARQDKDAAEREETAALEVEKSAASHRDTAREESERAEEVFQRAVETAGFDTLAAYREARSDLPNIEDLRRQTAEHDQAVSNARHRISELDAQLGRTERPDVDAAERALQSARSALEAARAEETRLGERLESDRRRVDRLEAIEAQVAETADTLRRIGYMAQVAAGENPLRTSFERYVMAELLDEILEAATARLSVMSRGRYALHRDVRAGDQRRRGGLDIVVHDDHTGKLRPASTLSGGEGFLASLALALGTSDVVQARSGGVRIDALYIDEGFGSLDSETLDQAMRVILDLQRRSDRVIGMISHIAEMKERIPARLEVVGGRRGSNVAIRLP